MNIEKFSADGASGVRFKDAVFAASKNYNGCHFDPLEVFTLDNPPANFNKSHLATEKLEGKFETTPSAEIDGKLIKFTADIVSMDPFVVENAEKVTGFSPELVPLNKPARRGKERFYAVGDLQWSATAFLFGEKPGFVGADKFDLEKFSVNEDVVIDESKVLEEQPKNDTKPEGKGKETFALVDDLREQMRWVKESQERNEKQMADLITAIRALSPAEGFSNTKTDQENKPKEQPASKTEDPKEPTEEEKKEAEKFAAVQAETERFNQIANAKKAIDDTKPVQRGAETSAGVNSNSNDILATF